MKPNNVKQQPKNKHPMMPEPSAPLDVNTQHNSGFAFMPTDNKIPDGQQVDIMQNKFNNFGVPRPAGPVMGPGRQQQEPLGVAALKLAGGGTPFSQEMRPTLHPGKPGSYPHSTNGGFNMLRRK